MQFKPRTLESHKHILLHCNKSFEKIASSSIWEKNSHSFIPYSVLRQIPSLFQSDFSIDSDPVFPLLISNILSFS